MHFPNLYQCSFPGHSTIFFCYYLEKHAISTMLIIKTAQELVSHRRDIEFEKRGRCDGPQLSI